MVCYSSGPRAQAKLWRRFLSWMPCIALGQARLLSLQKPSALSHPQLLLHLQSTARPASSSNTLRRAPSCPQALLLFCFLLAALSFPRRCPSRSTPDRLAAFPETRRSVASLAFARPPAIPSLSPSLRHPSLPHPPLGSALAASPLPLLGERLPVSPLLVPAALPGAPSSNQGPALLVARSLSVDGSSLLSSLDCVLTFQLDTPIGTRNIHSTFHPQPSSWVAV